MIFADEAKEEQKKKAAVTRFLKSQGLNDAQVKAMKLFMQQREKSVFFSSAIYTAIICIVVLSLFFASTSSKCILF